MSFLFNIDKEALQVTGVTESHAIAAEMLWQNIKEQAENIAKNWVRTYYTRRPKASGNYLIAKSPFNRNQPVITIEHGLQWLLCEMQPDLSKHKDILNDIVDYLMKAYAKEGMTDLIDFQIGNGKFAKTKQFKLDLQLQ